MKSLAFQEQDNAIAACATTAIWFALHGIGYNWGKNNISSPSEITLNAKKLISDYAKNALPNKGLLPSQMAHALREEGFEPLLMRFLNTSYLKALLRAYLNVRINAAGLKDRAFADSILAEAKAIADKAVAEEKEILDIVNAKIG